MITQPNRLPAGTDHPFRGSEINRSRQVAFRLDGRDIHAFAGDTLLTALLAAGVTGAGVYDGEPLALDERFAPPVLLRGTERDRLTALPLERTPAVEGLDLVTLGQAQRGRWRRWAGAVREALPFRRSHLGVRFDDDSTFIGPWFDAPLDRQRDVDLVVIGGGMAGLAAAQAAGKRGEKVVLIERRQTLGGDAAFFGSTGDEEAPEVAIRRLTTALSGMANVEILTRAEAFALFEGSVRVSLVEQVDTIPVSRVLTINAPRIILAPGLIERLPVFAGNRLPGVVSATAAFNRAIHHGVWIGKQAVIATATSVAYRVAMQAKDAGLTVQRIADTRLDPQSRFVAFGKAYGIPMARAMAPRHAAPGRGGRGLAVRLDHGFGEIARDADLFNVDQLVVSGGWQPDLSLWHMAGGSSRWQTPRNRLEPNGAVSGIVLAGSAAGYRTAAACMKSGIAAVAQLYGRAVPDIDDPEIEAIFETPDDVTPIGALDNSLDENSFLDGGSSLAMRPALARVSRRRLFRAARRPGWGFADHARPLGVADVAAGVQLGVIPPDDAPIVAQERCVTPGDIADPGRSRPVLTAKSTPALVPPPYLAGRFGPRPQVWLVEPDDGRAFEVGCLVFADSDATDPMAALGVVFAVAPAGRTGGLAVMGRTPAAVLDSKLFVRDISGAVPVKLVDPLVPLMQPVEIEPMRLEGIAPAEATLTPASTSAALALIAGRPLKAEKADAPAAAPGEAISPVAAAAAAVEGTAIPKTADGADLAQPATPAAPDVIALGEIPS